MPVEYFDWGCTPSVRCGVRFLVYSECWIAPVHRYRGIALLLELWRSAVRAIVIMVQFIGSVTGFVWLW
jgi:hypothetical protein